MWRDLVVAAMATAFLPIDSAETALASLLVALPKTALRLVVATMEAVVVRRQSG
jgi:hypothetical protein